MKIFQTLKAICDWNQSLICHVFISFKPIIFLLKTRKNYFLKDKEIFSRKRSPRKDSCNLAKGSSENPSQLETIRIFSELIYFEKFNRNVFNVNNPLRDSAKLSTALSPNFQHLIIILISCHYSQKLTNQSQDGELLNKTSDLWLYSNLLSLHFSLAQLYHLNFYLFDWRNIIRVKSQFHWF